MPGYSYWRKSDTILKTRASKEFPNPKLDQCIRVMLGLYWGHVRVIVYWGIYIYKGYVRVIVYDRDSLCFLGYGMPYIHQKRYLSSS